MGLAILPDPRNKRVDVFNSVGQQNQRFSQANGMAQAGMAHFIIGNGIQIRNVRKPHAAANQFCSAKPYCIVPDVLQKLRHITRTRQCPILGFLNGQCLKAFSESIPEIADVRQTLAGPPATGRVTGQVKTP